jgi:hypothetical protein
LTQITVFLRRENVHKLVVNFFNTNLWPIYAIFSPINGPNRPNNPKLMLVTLTPDGHVLVGVVVTGHDVTAALHRHGPGRPGEGPAGNAAQAV